MCSASAPSAPSSDRKICSRFSTCIRPFALSHVQSRSLALTAHYQSVIPPTRAQPGSVARAPIERPCFVYRCTGISPHPSARTELLGRTRGGTAMKLLFAVRNAVSGQKSLKASAWYIWY
ncbi:tryptorubin family RiPP precursor [Streptomyces hiroshimensis]|uniref:tryptorubin family RiPP precursor n=1 Tax=Streptomyces hiroshimensis TaxID=66424 RepID=UPI003570D074